jgi:hypothetical protein
MDAEMAKNFYDNHEWFNQFFDDLYNLVDKVAAGLSRERFEESAGRQYYKAQRKPSLPDIYTALFSREAGPRLILASLMKREYKNKAVPSEPALLVLAYDLDHDDQGIAAHVVNMKHVHPPRNDSALTLSGHLDLGKTVNFRGFFVPLDAFSVQNCTNVEDAVQEKIIEPLRTILDEPFTQPGKKSKTKE